MSVPDKVPEEEKRYNLVYIENIKLDITPVQLLSYCRPVDS